MVLTLSPCLRNLCNHLFSFSSGQKIELSCLQSNNYQEEKLVKEKLVARGVEVSLSTRPCTQRGCWSAVSDLHRRSLDPPARRHHCFQTNSLQWQLFYAVRCSLNVSHFAVWIVLLYEWLKNEDWCTNEMWPHLMAPPPLHRQVGRIMTAASAKLRVSEWVITQRGISLFRRKKDNSLLLV